MFNEELELKIGELEKQLRYEEEKYIKGVESHKDYNTLKSIRNHIHDMKYELEKLYALENSWSFTL
jgi:hypothetical protein